MEFVIEYYEALNGKQYVKEFLDELESENGELWNITVGLVKNLKYSKYHILPYSKAIYGGLFEIRPRTGKNTCRINYCFAGKQKIYLLNGFVKKDKKAQEREIKKARKLMQECKERSKKNV